MRLSRAGSLALRGGQGLAIGLVLAGLGCRSDGVHALEPAAESYWALTLNHHAVTLALAAPYDTLQLLATPRAPDGTVLPGLPPVEYLTTNEAAVTVDADGLLTGRELTPGTQVIARLTVRGVLHADTAYVAVTDDPGADLIASLSIQPGPGDSAKAAAVGSPFEPYRSLTPLILDAQGDTVAGIPIHFTTLDPTTSAVDPTTGTVLPVRIGPVRFAATMTAYGVSLADTVDYRIGYPLFVTVKFYGPYYAAVAYTPGSFEPDSVTIGVGGAIDWQSTGFLAKDSIDMTFDNPGPLIEAPEGFGCIYYQTDCDGTGNVPPFGDPGIPGDLDSYWLNYSRARRFSQPGVYPYQSLRKGTSGVIVVVDESGP